MHVPALDGEDDRHARLSLQHLDVAHRAPRRVGLVAETDDRGATNARRIFDSTSAALRRTMAGEPE